LREPGNFSLKLELAQLVALAKATNSKISVNDTTPKVTEVHFEGADLDPSDTLGDVLESEATVIAILQQKEGIWSLHHT
jgi:hypothetical protein